MKIKYILIMTFIATLFISCDDGEDYTDYSKTEAVSPQATYQVLGETETSISVDESAIDPEDGVTYTIEATLSETVPFDTFIDLTVVAGNATNGVDYSISRIHVNPLELTGTGSVTFFRTGDLEGDETVQITTNTNSPNVVGSETYDFTITNDYLNDNMIMTFDWCNDYELDLNSGVLTGNYGEKMDMDYYLADDAGNIVAMGATGDCPENIEMGGLPDGEYDVYAFLWCNELEANGFNVDVPITITYEQEFFVENTTLDSNASVNTDTTAPCDGMGTMVAVIAHVVKTGHEFTVTP